MNNQYYIKDLQYAIWVLLHVIEMGGNSPMLSHGDDEYQVKVKAVMKAAQDLIPTSLVFPAHPPSGFPVLEELTNEGTRVRMSAKPLLEHVRDLLRLIDMGGGAAVLATAAHVGSEYSHAFEIKAAILKGLIGFSPDNEPVVVDDVKALLRLRKAVGDQSLYASFASTLNRATSRIEGVEPPVLGKVRQSFEIYAKALEDVERSSRRCSEALDAATDAMRRCSEALDDGKHEKPL